MNSIFNKKLLEAEIKSLDDLDTDNMTEKEEWWKNKILAILINKNGKYGPYRHPKYAKRLRDDFLVKIVPPSVDKYFTAAVSAEDGVIYVGQGLLTNEDKIHQLNVVIRHELAHVLLAHQIRMTAKLGKIPYSHVKLSKSVHDLINIIADFEISNKKYSTEDKAIMKKLWIAGKEITCLVTEMHRPEWLKLPLEQMYDALETELDQVIDDLNYTGGDKERLSRTGTGKKLAIDDDMITQHGTQAFIQYLDVTSPSTIWLPIEEYIAKSKQFKKISPIAQDIVKQTYETFKDKPEDELKALLNKLINTKLVDVFPINKDLEVYVPEEKFWVCQVLKSLLGNARPKPAEVKVVRDDHSDDYKKAYNEIIKRCGSRSKCSDDEIKEILKKAMSEKGVDY